MKKLLFIGVLSLVFSSCLNDDALKVPFQSYAPAQLGDGWEIAEAQEVGVDGEALAEVYRYLHEDDNDWPIRSLLVFRNNKLVAESYMKDPGDITNLHPLWSATKGFIGVLTGIAVDEGLISIEDRISDFFPNAPSDKREITVENLLTMRSGIDYENDGYNGDDGKLFREIPSGSIEFVLGLGMHAPVGTSYRYKNSDPHLLSAIIQKQVGKTTRDWAKDVLLNKIGISNLEWRTYKDGVTFGGFGILSTPREMGKLGQLVANGGMWNGEQIVSEDWIDEMTTGKVPNASPESSDDPAFGYLWWVNSERDVVYTMGHGGQFIMVNREKNLTIVMTSEQHPAYEFGLLPDAATSIYERINNIAN